MKLLALAILCILAAATSSAAGTYYVEGISALSVSLFGQNIETVIHLLQGIQYLLWVVITELLGISIMQWVQQWRDRNQRVGRE